MKNIQAIILAAGKGIRMDSDIPKVLHRLAGQAMIKYTLLTLSQIGLKKPLIVVGFKGDLVKKTLKNKYVYAKQGRQLGTGHAVLSAKKYFPKNIPNALVLDGDDSAFYKKKTLVSLINKHERNKAVITLLTVLRENPSGLGRILRDVKGNIQAIIEEKEATASQKTIKEVNTGCYCFKTNFLWKYLPKIKKKKAGEYYLTDLIELALKEGKKVEILKLDNSNEWIGVNTREQLEFADRMMKKRK